MKQYGYNKAARLNFGLTALILLLTACVVLSTAYARYKTSIEPAELNMQTVSGGVYMYSDESFTPLSEWSFNAELSEYTVDMIISNAADEENFCKEDQNATLEIFATLGIADPSNITVKLTDENGEYTAQPTAVEKNSPRHISNGDGWIYRFFNAAGEELSWTLHGGEISNKNISVKIVGKTVENAALSLILSGNMVK